MRYQVIERLNWHEVPADLDDEILLEADIEIRSEFEDYTDCYRSYLNYCDIGLDVYMYDTMEESRI